MKLDLYQPTGDTIVQRPVVIWVHGGGFSGGDKRDDEYLAAPYVKRGFVAASINYRLLSNGCSGATLGPECTAAAARRHQRRPGRRALVPRQRRRRTGIDPTRIGIAGFSAGSGHRHRGRRCSRTSRAASGNPGYSSAVNGWVSASGGLPDVAPLVQKTDAGRLPLQRNRRPDGPLPVVGRHRATRSTQIGGIAVLKTQQGGGHNLPDLGLLASQSANFFYVTMNLADAQH